MIYHQHKKIFVALLVGMFLISFVSADISINPFSVYKEYEEENTEDLSEFIRGDFNSKYGAIKLTKSYWWLWEDRIAEYSLIENTDSCVINCEATINVKTHTDIGLLDDIKFMNLEKTKEVGINGYQFYIQQGTENKTQDIFGEVCVDKKTTSLNGTETQDCSYKKIGEEIIEVPAWAEYDGKKMPQGEYTLKIKGQKDKNKDVDWIIGSNGVWLDEWAEWTDDLNVDLEMYHDGNTTIDLMGNGHNLNLFGGAVNGSAGGIIPNALYNTGASGSYFTISNNTNLNYNTSSGTTINYWIKGVADSPTGSYKTMFKFYSAATYSIRVLSYGNVPYISISGVCQSLDLDCGASCSSVYDTWSMITIKLNSTAIAIFQDGTERISASRTACSVNLAGSLNLLTEDATARNYNAYMDELSFHNRDLSNSEITDLYNGGLGITQQFQSISVTLNAPADNFKTTDGTNLLFNATITPDVLNITNVTFRAGDKTDFQTFNTGEEFSTTWTETFTDGTYSWNVTGCGLGESGTHTCEDSATRTFEIDSTAPVITITTPGQIDYHQSGTNITINFTATDSNLDSCKFEYLGTNYSVACADKNVSLSMTSSTPGTIKVFANDTFGNEDFNTGIWSYKIFSNSVSFTTPLVESSEDTISTDSVINSTDFPTVVVRLNYDGTRYITTKSGNIYSYRITAPAVTGSETKDIIFEYELTNASGTFFINSTTYQQTITEANMSYCTTTPYINFTTYHEDTRQLLNTSFSANFLFGVTSLLNSFSYSETAGVNSTGNSTFSFCLEPAHITFNITGAVEVDAEEFVLKSYQLLNRQYTNQSQNINLYMLPENRSTSFILFVRDVDYSPVVEAKVEVERYYPGTNEWIVTERLLTNIEGKGIGHFVSEDVTYRFKVYVSDSLVLTTTQTKVFCEATPCTITITLLGDGENPISDFQNLTQFSSSLTHSKITDIITFTYSDTSSTSQGGRLLVQQNPYSSTSRIIVCDSSSTASSGILSCDLSTQSNGTFLVVGYSNRTENEFRPVERTLILKEFNIVSEIGVNGLIIGFFLLTGFMLLGLISPVISILFTIAAVVLLGMLKVISFTPVVLISIIAIGLFILWEMRK